MGTSLQIFSTPVRKPRPVRLLSGQTETRLTAAAAALDLGEESVRRPAAAGLAARFVAGEAAAFDLVVELHAPRVGRLAQRLLGWRDDGAVSVEDVVQDVFVAALRRRHTFRGGEVELWPWLARIAVNRCRSHGRRTALWLRWLKRRGEEPPAPTAPSADRRAVRDETSRRIRETVHKLPPADREVIVLCYLEELSVPQICTILGAKRGAIDTRLSRARKRLAVLLEQTLEEHPWQQRSET
jgi:RNA polymerase sigma-70 factor (ECF subfamily)